MMPAASRTIVSIDIQSSAKKPAAKNYRRIRDIDLLELEAKLRASLLFTSPTSATEAFTEQMENVVVSALDELAPLQKFKRRLSKNVTQWLSQTFTPSFRTSMAQSSARVGPGCVSSCVPFCS
jgi:hypothetical protein